jgi:hypothetical protein
VILRDYQLRAIDSARPRSAAHQEWSLDADFVRVMPLA